jgi:DNA modification methylase
VAIALQEDGWWLRQEIVWAKRAPMPESVRDRCTRSHEMVYMLAKNATYYYDQDAIREPHKRTWDESNGRGIYAGKNNPNQKQNDMPVLPHPNGANRRSVWSLGPEPTPFAHFATMPSKLAEICVLAGTSAHGACAKCGAPYECVVEEERTNYKTSTYANTAANGAIKGGVGKIFPDTTRTTTGWHPTCQCGADVVPCVVLDPFNGAATTGLVALKHHRRYIGIELNAEYLALSEQRLSRVQPTLLEVI